MYILVHGKAQKKQRTRDVFEDGSAEALEVRAVEGRAELREHVEDAARRPHVHALGFVLVFGVCVGLGVWC